MSHGYDRTLRDSQRESTRASILAAAERVAAAGVAGFTVAGVAAEAGVALRTVYTHFASRAELLNAVLRPSQAMPPGLDGAPPRTTQELLYRLQRSFGSLAAGLPPYKIDADRRAALDAQHAAVASALRTTLATLSPRERQRLLNAVLLVSDASSATVCRDALGLDPSETGQLVAWCVEVLVRAAEER